MSRIPKKKSRRITVDGRLYRWLPQGGKGNIRGSSNPRIFLIAQAEAEKPGDALRVGLSSKLWDAHPEWDGQEDNCHMDFRFPLTPGEVATLIRHAVSAGWDPTKGSGAFDLITPVELPNWTVMEPRNGRW